MKINQTFINASVLTALCILACTSVYAEDTRAGNYLPPSVTTTQPISSAKLSPTNTTAGFQINTPGYYYLSTDVEYNPNNAGAGATNTPAIYINADNVTLDLGTKTIYLGTPSGGAANNEAVVVVANKKNITIKNGTISGFAPNTGALHLKGGNKNIAIEDLVVTSCTAGNPISIDTGTNVGIALRNVQVISNSSAASMAGATIAGVKYLEITNCSFSANSTSADGASCTGLLLSNCSDIEALNIDASNNQATATAMATPVYGIRLESGTKNTRFINCRAMGNSNGTTASTTGTTNATAYGFSLDAATANYFENCVASGQFSIGLAYGVSLANGSNANVFKNCLANVNISNPSGLTTPLNGGNVFGFYLSSSNANKFLNCEANGNIAQKVAGTPALMTYYIYDATGLYSTGGKANMFLDCTAARNGSGGHFQNYTATVVGGRNTYQGTSYSSGLRLDNERATVIRNCTSQANNALNPDAATGSANGTAVGLLLSNIAGVCANCIVDNNMISNNQSLESDDGDTGRSIGYWDQAADSTTFLVRNTSTGQGTVYAGKTELVVPTTSTGNSVNYYFTYNPETTSSFNPENIIKETDISNLNAIALSGGENLFNWSIVTNSQA